MKHSLLRTLRNPLIVIPPFVVVMGVGWQQYTYAGRNFNLAAANMNLLPNSNLASIGTNGLPTGWQLAASGSLNYTVAQAKGYASGDSTELTVNNYASGDVALTTPRVSVQPNGTYLFKSYYTTDAPFALLLHSYFSDGTSTLQLLRTYPTTGTGWSTVSDAFTAAPNATGAQIEFRAYNNGSLTLNAPYFEPQQQVYVSTETGGTGALPNGQLAPGQYDAPADWSTYHAGNNEASFSYGQDANGNYIETQVTGYQTGQAKWQYVPQAVTPNQYYNLSLTYWSNATVPVVAEYVLSDGTIQDQVVNTLPPADDWTTAAQQFEVPAKATTLFVSVPLEHNGIVGTRDYELANITKPGPAEWQRPLVSLTFDNGWQDTYDNVLPGLQQYGYSGTFYVNPATIETSGIMSAGELEKLQNSGNEIAADGYDRIDLTTISQSALDYQLREGRDYLRSAGFPVSDFAVPYGRSDAEVRWNTMRYYTTTRGTDNGINTLQNIDPYNLKVLYITSNTTTQTITTALQTAKSENGWLILVYQHVTDDPLQTDGSVTPAAFKQQLALIRSSNITVSPVTKAYAELQKQ
jgi:peptidoglycan/xylan/chitin deacetylase (PgdA/CDA1 family)